jgi:chromatin remodeling complex protein RSC6
MPRAAIRKSSKSPPSKSMKTKRSNPVKSSLKKAPVKSVKKVADVAVAVAVPAKEEVGAPPPTVNKRRSPTRESVLDDFETLIMSVDAEIQHLREGPAKTKGVKFLRSLNKNIKLLRNRTARVMKQKQKTGRTNNKNSGFLKPVTISKEMAKFTGWDPKDLRSRVEVTKYICQYISEHDLQNPEDRRQIKPDVKLQKLLGYNPKKTKEPLRYYSLQTHLKHHFPKKD